MFWNIFKQMIYCSAKSFKINLLCTNISPQDQSGGRHNCQSTAQIPLYEEAGVALQRCLQPSKITSQWDDGTPSKDSYPSVLCAETTIWMTTLKKNMTVQFAKILLNTIQFSFHANLKKLTFLSQSSSLVLNRSVRTIRALKCETKRKIALRFLELQNFSTQLVVTSHRLAPAEQMLLVAWAATVRDYLFW